MTLGDTIYMGPSYAVAVTCVSHSLAVPPSPCLCVNLCVMLSTHKSSSWSVNSEGIANNIRQVTGVQIYTQMIYHICIGNPDGYLRYLSHGKGSSGLDVDLIN